MAETLSISLFITLFGIPVESSSLKMNSESRGAKHVMLPSNFQPVLKLRRVGL